MGTWYEGPAVPMFKNRQASKSGRWTEKLRAGSGDPADNLVGVNVTYELDGAGNLETVSIHPPADKAASAYWSRQVKKIVETSSTIRIEGRLPPPQAVGRALLYWAFLKLTAEVGYAFAGAPGSRVVAEALLDPASTVLGSADRLQVPAPGVVLRDLEPSEPFFWMAAGDLSQIECLGWRFGDFLVMLPWPTDAAGQIYRKLDGRAAQGLTNFGSGKVLTGDLLKRVYQAAPTTSP